MYTAVDYSNAIAVHIFASYMQIYAKYRITLLRSAIIKCDHNTSVISNMWKYHIPGYNIIQYTCLQMSGFMQW